MDTDPMRLDSPGVTFHYVSDTAEWKARCIKRYLLLDEEIDAHAVALLVDDMAQSSRWRLMAPEEAAEIVYEQPRPRS
jgi:hypothetical protein